MALKTPVKEGLSKNMKQETQPPAPKPPGKSIFDLIPVSLVLQLAKPYLAGENATDAITLAHQLYREDNYSATLDILGEDASSDSDCDASVQHYKELIDAIVANPLPLKEPVETRRNPTVSFKPSMFATKAPEIGQVRSEDLDKAYNRIETLVSYAADRNINCTLEAEDHRWTDFQLESYFSLIQSGYRNIGTVLQARLFRTANDIKRFDQRMRVRLVIGIYNEPAHLAHTSKAKMKELLVNFSRELLARGTYVEVATHDTKCLADFFAATVNDRVSPDRFETQYLHGVPRRRFQQALVSGQLFKGDEYKKIVQAKECLDKLASQGVLVRMYLPFGEGRVSGAYCRRRLKENPNMITYGIKNLLGINS